MKKPVGQIVRDLNYHGPIFIRSSNKPRTKGKRPKDSYRSSKESAEKESDQFIYEGLSNIERFSLHRSKQRAYNLLSNKI